MQTSSAPTATFSIARFVDDIRAFAPRAGRAGRFETLPNGKTSLVYRVTDGGRSSDVAVLGPRTRALFKRPTGVARVVLLQLKPGWSRPLLGVPASALTDRIVPLEHIWGRAGDDIAAELLEARDVPDILARLSRAIARRAQHGSESASAQLARRAARSFEDGESRVERVAEELGVTPRHLRRAFTESIGIGPKQFARGVRLRRAARMAATSTNWVRIAADAGYHDQAHLIRDFRELVGLTPGAWARRAAEHVVGT